MKKTVVIAINTSWNIYNFRMGLVNALLKEGYRVVAVAPRDDYSEKLIALGMEYREIQMNNKGTNPLEDLKLTRAYYEIYKEISPDIILQYTIKPNIYGTIAASFLNIPTLCNISGLGTVFLNESLPAKVARFFYRVSMKRASVVFFQNRDDRQLFMDAKLVEEQKTKCLPGSGIDTQKYAPVPFSHESDEVKFLLIARLVRDKGIIEYVEAAKMFLKEHTKQRKRAKFYLLGPFYPGNPTAISPEEVEVWESEGVICYLGESDDVRSVIPHYDCIVLPSYREGLSRVLLEASSMGKPIVTTDVPGCRDVVEDGYNGFLCEVKESRSLYEKMYQMFSLSAEEREAIGRNGRTKVVNEFDEKIVIDTYLDTIRHVVGKQPF